MLTDKLIEIVEKDKFTITEAKSIVNLLWFEEDQSYSNETIEEIKDFFLFVEGLIEEVEEGYVDGSITDEYLLNNAKHILDLINDG